MNSPFDNLFGSGSHGFGGGRPVDGIMQAMDQLRSAFEQRTTAPRMQRGDVRAAVLSLLAEQPMHGYQIIREIGERSGGTWKPSAGSVYPTLQLLADEALITADESNGRKTYSLTEAGRLEAEAATENPAPWETSGNRENRDGSGRLTALPKAGVELAQAAAQVGRSGNAEQVQQAVDVLDEARRKLYAILAQN